MKIYIATSWKLELEAKALAENLRMYGHEVDLFCDPTTGRFVFSFQALGDPSQLDQHQINANELAQRAFIQDRSMIEWSDAVVMMLPCGKSAHLEAGYAKGLGKKLFIFDREQFPKGQIDVMYQFADGLASSFHELRGMLDANEAQARP